VHRHATVQAFLSLTLLYETRSFERKESTDDGGGQAHAVHNHTPRTSTWHVPPSLCGSLASSTFTTGRFLYVCYVRTRFSFGAFSSFHIRISEKKNIGDMGLSYSLGGWEGSNFLVSCNNLLSSFKKMYILSNCEMRIDPKQ
jgi:hypothetical protein